MPNERGGKKGPEPFSQQNRLEQSLGFFAPQILIQQCFMELAQTLLFSKIRNIKNFTPAAGVTWQSGYFIPGYHTV